MEKRIGIVGAGVAGLHLGLYLRQHGMDATIIVDRTADELARARLPNTAAHFAVTLERERLLGVDHWPNPDLHYTCHHHSLPCQKLAFRGDLRRPSRAVDHRIYVPLLMEDFAARGGKIEVENIGVQDLARLTQRFDLVVVASGRGALAEAFAPVAAWSPHQRPQRQLLAGLFTGVRRTDPAGATLSLSPGHGELLEIPILTFGGLVSAMLFETVRGGDLEALAHLRYEESPAQFVATVLEKLARHHPQVYHRIDPSSFDLCAANDVLQGGEIGRAHV